MRFSLLEQVCKTVDTNHSSTHLLWVALLWPVVKRTAVKTYEGPRGVMDIYLFEATWDTTVVD